MIKHSQATEIASQYQISQILRDKNKRDNLEIQPQSIYSHNRELGNPNISCPTSKSQRELSEEYT